MCLSKGYQITQGQLQEWTEHSQNAVLELLQHKLKMYKREYSTPNTQWLSIWLPWAIKISNTYASWSLLKEYTVVDRSFLIVTESLFINGVSNCSSINWRCTNENLRLSPSSYLIVDHELTIESVQDLNFRLSMQTELQLHQLLG